jgi:hypothetical protein
MVGPDSGRAAHVGVAIFGVVITEREDGTAGRYSAGTLMPLVPVTMRGFWAMKAL